MHNACIKHLYTIAKNWSAEQIFKPDVSKLKAAWFFEIAFVRDVSMCVCVHPGGIHVNRPCITG